MSTFLGQPMRSDVDGRRLLIVWAATALAVGGPMLIGNHLRATKPYPLAYPIALALTSASFWTALTPILQRMVTRFPFSPARRALAVTLRAAGFVATVKGHAVLFAVVTAAFGLQGDRRLAASAEEFAVGIGIQLYVIIVAVISVLRYQSRTQRAELALVEAQRLSTEARSLALRSQLNAHFLFNTLNTVAMAIRRSDREQALAIVVGLGALLRTALRRTSTELIPLKDEIEFVAKYLEIEQVRFRDRLNVEWLVAPEVQRAAVPALILQPIVENALRHGIGRRSDAGLLRIQAGRSGDTLAITVDDDGPGFDRSWSEGVGLANVRSRLQIHFAERAGLEIAGAGRGASVRLTLPFSQATADAEVQDAHRR